MDSSKLLGWLQFGGTIGVLIGLLLVGVQINQTAELTRLQMDSDWRADWIEQNLVMMGESPTDALAKAIDDPNSITTSELLVLENYISSYVEYWARAKVMSDVGLFPADRWKDHFGGEVVNDAMEYWFGNQVSQAWWASFEEKGGVWAGDEEFNSALSQAIAKIDSSAMADWHAAIRSKVEKSTD